MCLDEIGAGGAEAEAARDRARGGAPGCGGPPLGVGTGTAIAVSSGLSLGGALGKARWAVVNSTGALKERLNRRPYPSPCPCPPPATAPPADAVPPPPPIARLPVEARPAWPRRKMAPALRAEGCAPTAAASEGSAVLLYPAATASSRKVCTRCPPWPCSCSACGGTGRVAGSTGGAELI